MASTFDVILGKLRQKDADGGDAHEVEYNGETASAHGTSNVGDALDKILNKIYYTAVSISSFTGGGTYEVGTTISSVNFSWTLNKNPLSIKLTNGLIVKNIAVSERSYAYTPDTPITTDATFTLRCGDVTDSGAAVDRTVTTKIVFLNKLFYNTTTTTPTTQEAIVALGVSGDKSKTHWSNSKTVTHVFKGKKFCIALPSSMKISKAVTSNNETITSKFVAGDEIDYTIGSTTTKYKVHTFEVAAEMDVTLTITLA